MSLYCRPGSHSAAILAASARAWSASRNSSTKRIAGTLPYSISDSCSALISSSYAWPIPSRNAMAAAASASSILDSAKPTWISTHSPGLGGSSASSPMLISRLTPLTFTLARSGCSGWSSTTSPGMPRHMRHLLCAAGGSSAACLADSGAGQFPEHLIDRRLRLLDPVDRGGRHDEQVVDAVQLGHLSARVARQPDGQHPAAAGLVEGTQQVGGVAACRQADRYVVTAAERSELPRENDVDADVVA